MAIDTKTNGTIPSEVVADGEAILEAVMAGRRPDPLTAQRVRDRAASITEEIRKKHGILDIGTKAIRELRDQ